MKGWTLVVLSILCGAGALLVIRHTADLRAIRTVRKRMQAHLLEFRLFPDEPVLIWRAQLALVADNLRFFVLMLRPALIVTIPMAWLMLQFDAIYGAAPLRVGEPAVVTAHLDSSARFDAPFGLQAPPGIQVETPPVRIPGEREVSWRIRPDRPVSGSLRFGSLEKSVAAGSGAWLLSRSRVRSIFAWLLHPEEARLPAGAVTSIEVDYPVDQSWIAWFLGISTLSALVLGRWLRVPL